MAVIINDELRDILERTRDFIDNEVIPSEPLLREASLDSLVEMERLKAEAKKRGLWALGHPKEIGGGAVLGPSKRILS